MLAGTVDDNRRTGSHQPAFQPIAQSGNPFCAIACLGLPYFKRFGHARNQRNRFGPGTMSRFLMSSELHRLELHALAQQQCTNAARSVKLMCTQTERRDSQLVKVDRYFSHRLHGVDMNRNFTSATLFGQRGQVLYHASLIMRQND